MMQKIEVMDRTMSFSAVIKKSLNGDEYFSPQNVVDLIVPYILGKQFKVIWCPFDKADSKFVTTFQGLGLAVNYGHIDTGQDFFSIQKPMGDVIVSNPPYSKREAIIDRLYEFDIPFAIVLNFNGLFDSKARRTVFKEHEPQLLIPDGRMRFYDGEKLNHPNFQSIYLCNKLLARQIEFSDMVFK